ncbi:hypothetical protein NHX12_023388 [Muraenolepis orangiensis]|uniref:RRM domain-containing protein n=1 Tax=Muraenolepis orangiensis TaxID=630683 RepID=A0A9Q0ELY9_9TELE|nr:hypothetical protein NHX12_023388 [Muraenolepis orangiensis]
MSDIEDGNFEERESRSPSKSDHAGPARVKSESRSRTPSPVRVSKRSESRSRSKSRSHSRHRRYSRSRSTSHRAKRSRSYSPEYRRRKSQSKSPSSGRRHHASGRSHDVKKESSNHGDAVRANPDPNTCLGVFGLSLYTTERDLREVFSRYGPLAGVNVVYDQRTGRSRGFAFAIERANGMELDGRRIRVDFSITKRAHTPTPGIYMGRPTHNGGSYERYDEYDSRCSRRRSPSPYYSRYRSRSRSRSYSPRRY